jgi:hypothetical protein
MKTLIYSDDEYRAQSRNAEANLRETASIDLPNRGEELEKSV